MSIYKLNVSKKVCRKLFVFLKYKPLWDARHTFKKGSSSIFKTECATPVLSTNLEKMKKYDVIIIGSGPAGATVADQCKTAGKSVAVADSLFGGTCYLKGCTPKKALATVTEAYRHAKHLQHHGIQFDSLKLDWTDLLKFKRSFTELGTAQAKSAFAKKGIDCLEGIAEFISNTELKVDNISYKADHFAICTGATPAPLSFSGSNHLVTSDQVMELDNMPQSVAFVGGGYVAFELAQNYSNDRSSGNYF